MARGSSWRQPHLEALLSYLTPDTEVSESGYVGTFNSLSEVQEHKYTLTP